MKPMCDGCGRQFASAPGSVKHCWLNFRWYQMAWTSKDGMICDNCGRPEHFHKKYTVSCKQERQVKTRALLFCSDVFDVPLTRYVNYLEALVEHLEAKRREDLQHLFQQNVKIEEYKATEAEFSKEFKMFLMNVDKKTTCLIEQAERACHLQFLNWERMAIAEEKKRIEIQGYRDWKLSEVEYFRTRMQEKLQTMIEDGSPSAPCARDLIQMFDSNGFGKCVVCMDNSEWAAVPCGHACLCKLCKDKFRDEDRSCPVCRAEIEDFLRIYF
eukprot:95466-Hanusia_phi.AAC.7